VFASSSFAGSIPDGGPRLRAQDDRVKGAIREGAARSSTFKALVDRLESSDVIVYIAVNPTIKSNLSGMLTWMTRAGGFRYVRASISPDQTLDQMIATVAHELRHAVEVAEDSTVQDEHTLVAMYRKIGRQNGSDSWDRWETTAAQQAGFQVRRELVSTPASTIAARVSSDQTVM
jgi:hypothetical protein